MDSPPVHRGRIQAQGGGIEESETWAQNNALTGAAGRTMLTKLQAKLTEAEAAHRGEAFGQARGFIDRAEKSNGVDASHGVIRKSYPVKPRIDGRRVDIEVHKGKAFVPATTEASSTKASDIAK